MQGGQAELTWVADSALRWFTYPKTVYDFSFTLAVNIVVVVVK